MLYISLSNSEQVSKYSHHTRERTRLPESSLTTQKQIVTNMKKTIAIIAACLASPLWAIDFSSSIADLSSTDNTITVTGAAGGNYIGHAVLTLDVSAIKTYLTNPTASLTNLVSLEIKNGSNNVGLSLYNSNFVAHDKTGVGDLDTDLTITTPTGVTTSLEGLGSIFTTDVTDAVLTYSHSGNGSIAYLTVMKTDGTLLNYADKRSSYRSTGDARYIETFTFNENYITAADAYVVDSPITAADAFALNRAKLVPEPTTATLSLLALAGLAARRRRK